MVCRWAFCTLGSIIGFHREITDLGSVLVFGSEVDRNPCKRIGRANKKATNFWWPSHRWWFIAELGIVFVELAAPAQELTLVGRHFKFVEDGVHRADWLAIGTIDAHF